MFIGSHSVFIVHMLCIGPFTLCGVSSGKLCASVRGDC